MGYIRKGAYWTEARVKGLLEGRHWSPTAVIDCLLAVYENQTADEQEAEHTRHQNGRGFTDRDAEFGTSLVKQHLAGREWSAKQWEYARKMALRYWGQFAAALEAERTGLVNKTVQSSDGDGDGGDRFTWEPGDLRKETPGQRPRNPGPMRDGGQATSAPPSFNEPLFDDDDEWAVEPDENVPHPADTEGEMLAHSDEDAPYRTLAQVDRECKGNSDCILGSREFTLLRTAMDHERLAWLRMQWSLYGTDLAWQRIPLLLPRPGLDQDLAAAYGEAEEERVRVLVTLGIEPRNTGSYQPYSIGWANRFGAGRKGFAEWAASPAYKLWIDEEALLAGRAVLDEAEAKRKQAKAARVH